MGASLNVTDREYNTIYEAISEHIVRNTSTTSTTLWLQQQVNIINNQGSTVDVKNVTVVADVQVSVTTLQENMTVTEKLNNMIDDIQDFLKNNSSLLSTTVNIDTMTQTIQAYLKDKQEVTNIISNLTKIFGEQTINIINNQGSTIKLYNISLSMTMDLMVKSMASSFRSNKDLQILEKRIQSDHQSEMGGFNFFIIVAAVVIVIIVIIAIILFRKSPKGEMVAAGIGVAQGQDLGSLLRGALASKMGGVPA
jgi:hypothetical protein